MSSGIGHNIVSTYEDIATIYDFFGLLSTSSDFF